MGVERPCPRGKTMKSKLWSGMWQQGDHTKSVFFWLGMLLVLGSADVVDKI